MRQIRTELKVSFDYLVEHSRADLELLLKARLVDDVRDIESLRYYPLEVIGNDIVVHVWAEKFDPLPSDGTSEEIKQNILDSDIDLNSDVPF